MSKDIERRFVPFAGAEIRSTKGEGGRMGITGTAAVFNSMSEEIRMGAREFREVIAPGAFDRALARSDIRALFNHEPSMILGRVKAGTMRVWTDERGLHYEVPQLPESRRDVSEAIERGDVDGNSFGFVVAEKGDKFSFRDGGVVRTITEIEEILDLGPVTFPAYEATRVSKRAIDMADAAQEVVSVAPDITPLASRRRELDLAELE